MRSRRLHSRRSAATAALFFIGIFAILAAHLDANSPIPDLLVPSRRAPMRQAHRADSKYLASRRGIGFGVPRYAYRNAVASMRAMELRAKSSGFSTSAATQNWSSIGPLPIANEIPTFGGIPVGPALTSATGRVTAIAVDTLTSGRLFVGTAGGGVWMSTNGGATFTPIFDAQPTLSIGAIALDPATNPPTIYVGTGEGDNTGDSYYGLGIFASSDLGITWTQNTAGGSFTNDSFARIAIDTSKSPRTLYAAVSVGSSSSRGASIIIEGNTFDNGLWRSTDGALTWTHPQFASQTACPSFGGKCPAGDVAIDPALPNNVYVSIVQLGVFKSSNSGATWRALSFPGIADSTIGRASIAALNGTVYAMLGGADGAEYVGFFKSSNSGASWTAEQVPAATLGTVTIDGTSPANVSESFFDQALTIDPSDASGATVIFGGVGMYRSLNSGASWNFLGQNGGIHSGQHAIAMDPFNAGNFFAGNDGGAYSFSPPSTWTALNTTIAAAQLQSIGPDPGDITLAISGSQDNGTLRCNSTQSGEVPQPWNSAELNASGFAVFDRVNPNFAYHDSATAGIAASIASSSDAGVTWSSGRPSDALNGALANANDAGPGFFGPIASDPAVARRVLFGAHHVYVSNDAMQSWGLQSSQDLSGGCSSGVCAIQDLEFAPSERSVAYSLSTQTLQTSSPTPFRIFVTLQADTQVTVANQAGGLWSDVTGNLPFQPADTQATGLAVSPFDPATVYLSVSGFTSATGIGHVFMSNDFGGHWFRADGNAGGVTPAPLNALPDIPVLRLLVDTNDRSGQTILAGTDIGVFRSTDSGSDWAPFNLSVIPAVSVFDIEQNLNGDIFAATHGRGAFLLSGAVGPIATPTSPPSATFGVTPSPRFTPTVTPRPTVTAAPTVTQVVTATPIPTQTPIPTRTASAIPTIAPTTAPTATHTIVGTATPTARPTPLTTVVTLASKLKKFGKAVLGNAGVASKPQVVTLINKSTNVVALFGQAFAGPSGADFHVVAAGTTCGSKLGARAKCNYALVFQPTVLGVRNAQALIDNNAANAPQIEGLNGSAIQGAIVLAPKSISLGSVTIGKSATGSFGVTNRNPVALTIANITSTSTDFKPANTCIGILNAGTTCTVSVVFAPAAGGKRRSGTIQIFDNAARSPQSVRVSGSAN